MLKQLMWSKRFAPSRIALKLIRSRLFQLLCNKPNYFSSKANPSIELLVAQISFLHFAPDRIKATPRASLRRVEKKLNFQPNWLRIDRFSQKALGKSVWLIDETKSLAFHPFLLFDAVSTSAASCVIGPRERTEKRVEQELGELAGRAT